MWFAVASRSQPDQPGCRTRHSSIRDTTGRFAARVPCHWKRDGRMQSGPSDVRSRPDRWHSVRTGTPPIRRNPEQHGGTPRPRTLCAPPSHSLLGRNTSAFLGYALRSTTGKCAVSAAQGAMRPRFSTGCRNDSSSGFNPASAYPNRSGQLSRSLAAIRWKRFQPACRDFTPPCMSIGRLRSSRSFLANWSGCTTCPKNPVLQDRTTAILPRRARAIGSSRRAFTSHASFAALWSSYSCARKCRARSAARIPRCAGSHFQREIIPARVARQAGFADWASSVLAKGRVRSSASDSRNGTGDLRKSTSAVVKTTDSDRRMRLRARSDRISYRRLPRRDPGPRPRRGERGSCCCPFRNHWEPLDGGTVEEES